MKKLHIQVKTSDMDLTKREEKILEIFILNLCAQSNSATTGKNMVINPPDGDGLVDSDLFFESEITPQQHQDLKEMMTRRVKSMFKMCGLSEPEISFT